MYEFSRSSAILATILFFAYFNEAKSEYQPDLFNGRLQFSKCQVCHSLNPNDKKPGPSLLNLFGRKSGSLEGYEYSKAMKSADIIWDKNELDLYLADPKNKIPGSKMIFGGLKRPSDRADVIAYLISLQK